MITIRRAAVIVLMVGGWINLIFGQSYFSNTGGTQRWDSASANWGASSGGPYENVWAGGDAIFEGTAGSVTVDVISANSLTFNVSGYTLTGGPLTLEGPVITATSGTTTIAAGLSGTQGLIKTGSGTLILSAEIQ